jgi:hypothetical protein
VRVFLNEWLLARDDIINAIVRRISQFFLGESVNGTIGSVAPGLKSASFAGLTGDEGKKHTLPFSSWNIQWRREKRFAGLSAHLRRMRHYQKDSPGCRRGWGTDRSTSRWRSSSCSDRQHGGPVQLPRQSVTSLPSTRGGRTYRSLERRGRGRR